MATTAIVLIASLVFFLLGAALGHLATRASAESWRRGPARHVARRPEAATRALPEPPDEATAHAPPPSAGDGDLGAARREAEIAAHRAEELAAALAETRARGAAMIEALRQAEEALRAAERERESYAAESRLLRQERDRLTRRADAAPPAKPASKAEIAPRPPRWGTWWCQECQRGGTSVERCAHAR